MPYRTPGKMMKKEFKFSLTKDEIIEAVTRWMIEQGHSNTPRNDYNQTAIKVGVVYDAYSPKGHHQKLVAHVGKGLPFQITWKTIVGEKP